jgi:hypothetical protein
MAARAARRAVSAPSQPAAAQVRHRHRVRVGSSASISPPSRPEAVTPHAGPGALDRGLLPGRRSARLNAAPGGGSRGRRAGARGHRRGWRCGARDAHHGRSRRSARSRRPSQGGFTPVLLHGDRERQDGGLPARRDRARQAGGRPRAVPEVAISDQVVGVPAFRPRRVCTRTSSASGAATGSWRGAARWTWWWAPARRCSPRCRDRR